MLVYVLDIWETVSGERKATRPWSDWYSEIIPGQLQLGGQASIRPLAGKFRTPSVVIAHWTYITGECGETAEKMLHQIAQHADGLHIIVVSGAQLHKSGLHGRIYFRPTIVGTKTNDPFRKYLCEFLRALGQDAAPDFSLLEPEPTPSALMDIHTKVTLNEEFPLALGEEAKRQCLRIVSRGYMGTTHQRSEIEWLMQANWLETSLIDDQARQRFIQAINVVLDVNAKHGGG